MLKFLKSLLFPKKELYAVFVMKNCCETKKVNVIKVVRNVTGLGLKEAKAMVDDSIGDLLLAEDVSENDAIGYCTLAYDNGVVAYLSLPYTKE